MDVRRLSQRCNACGYSTPRLRTACSTTNKEFTNHIFAKLHDLFSTTRLVPVPPPAGMPLHTPAPLKHSPPVGLHISTARASFHARLPSGPALVPALCASANTASPSLPSHTRARKLHPHTCLLLPYVTCPLLPRVPAPSNPCQHIRPSDYLTSLSTPVCASTTQHTPLPIPFRTPP